MRKKTFPIEEIINLIENENYTTLLLAKHFKTSRPTIEKFLRENQIQTNYQKNKERYTFLPRENISKKYQEGSTIRELEEEYKCSQKVIEKILQETNTHIRTNSESHTVYPSDISYFEKIDTLNKSYLLGFICADGFTTDRHEVGIAVQKRDKGVVDFFKKELKTSKPIREKDNCFELRLQNKVLYESLFSLGIVPRKSLIINIRDVIEKAELNSSQIKAFLLGYFDGDGGIYMSYAQNKKTKQWSCSVTGTFETCSYYKEYFQNVGFFTKRHPDEKNNYTYYISGRNRVKTALSEIYSIKDEIDFFYQRKYEKFVELSKSPRAK